MASPGPAEEERNELGHAVEEVRGKSLRVVERTYPSSDLCVFFVHGGGGRAGQFKHQIKALENEYNVLALDFLGHGESPAPNQPSLYTADEHFEDLKAVYEAHKKTRNVFVSHCYGCIHTLRLVRWLREAGRGEEIRGFLALSLGAQGISTGSWVSHLPAFFLEWLRPLARSKSNQLLFTSNTDPKLIEFENTMGSNNRMYMMKVLGSDCSNHQMWTRTLEEGREALGDIPRISIYGEEDGLFPVATCQEADRVLGVGEGGSHPLPGVGHLCMLEGHVEVLHICREFISGL